MWIVEFSMAPSHRFMLQMISQQNKSKIYQKEVVSALKGQPYVFCCCHFKPLLPAALYPAGRIAGGLSLQFH